MRDENHSLMTGSTLIYCAADVTVAYSICYHFICALTAREHEKSRLVTSRFNTSTLQ